MHFSLAFLTLSLLHPNIQLTTATLSNRQDNSYVYFNLSIFR